MAPHECAMGAGARPAVGERWAPAPEAYSAREMGRGGGCGVGDAGNPPLATSRSVSDLPRQEVDTPDGCGEGTSPPTYDGATKAINKHPLYQTHKL